MNQTQASFNNSAVNANNTNYYANTSNVTVQSQYNPTTKFTFALEQLKKVRERGSEDQGIS